MAAGGQSSEEKQCEHYLELSSGVSRVEFNLVCLTPTACLGSDSRLGSASCKAHLASGGELMFFGWLELLINAGTSDLLSDSVPKETTNVAARDKLLIT